MYKTHTIKTSFIGSKGNRLDARLERPDATPKAFIIFAHCFTCTKDILIVYRSSRLLAQQGYAVLRFDFAGLGDSEGDFSDCNFSTTVEDTHAAINFLKENYTTPSILIGHSLGGTTSLATAATASSIEKVVTIAAPSQASHVLHHFEHALSLLEQNIPASFEVAGKFYDINPQFVTDVRSWDMQQILNEVTQATLVFKIENDAQVAENNADEIVQWTRGETDLITLQGTDHLLSDKQANSEVIEKIVDWLEQRQGSESN